MGILGRKTWALGLAVVASLVSIGAALADKEQIHLTAEGQRAARAAVISQSDMGSAPGWTRKVTKPDLSGGTGCPGFDPKQSDLVLNGVYDVSWSRPGIEFDTEAQVLETPSMVKLDWQRSVLAPQVMPCLRSLMQKQLNSAEKIVSVSRLSVPAIGTYTRAYRILVDYTQNGQTIRLFIDLLLIGRGRTEVTFMTTAPFAAEPAVRAAEVRLARLLVARAV